MNILKLKHKFHIYNKEMLCFLINNNVSLNFITKNYENLYIIRNSNSKLVNYLGYLVYCHDSNNDEIIIEFLT